MKNYAITRIKKHASVKSATYLVNHHLRLAEVHNADPKRLAKNEVLHQVEDIQGFLNEVPKGTKKNACRFVDVLFTASRFENKQQLEQWKKETYTFACKTFGKENIALAVVHNDETTPHMHLIFKPVNPKTGKLGAGHWFDGRTKMQKYQDSYHKAVGHLGFDRGEPGSRAKHKTIKQFYRDVAIAKEEVQKFNKSFHLIEQEVKNMTLWDRFNPKKLHQRIRTHLVAAYGSAKKILLVKQVLEVERTNKQNQDLLEQISAVKDKLEMVTGMENPTYVDLQKFKEKMKVEEPTTTSPDPKEGTPSPTPQKPAPIGAQRPRL